MKTPKDNAPSKPIHIIVDHREANSGVPDALTEIEDITFTFAKLSVGDYEVGDSLVFERKTLPDLIASIKDGRIFRQAKRLAALPPHKRGAIILEGTSSAISDSAMRREAIQGALITITIFFGIPLLRSMSCEETARLMLYAAHQEQIYKTGALQRKGKRPKGKKKLQLQILQGLPGVGPDRAQQLLDKFGSIEAVLAAGAKELMATKGIGKTTAKAIRWIASEEKATYK